MTGNDLADRAIPHEAGHILVCLALGFPVHGMAVEVTIVGSRILLGDFITEAKEPPDEQIPLLPQDVLDRYKLYVGAGLAGNKFSGIAAENESLESDRRQLRRVGSETLEEIADKALVILKDNPVIFQGLVTAIELRLKRLMNDPYLMTGRHRILNEQELKTLCRINDSPTDAPQS